MRHFCTSKQHVITSYCINAGEYRLDGDSVFNDAIRELAKTLEVDVTDLRELISHIVAHSVALEDHAGGSESAEPTIAANLSFTGNEISVVEEFVSFARAVFLLDKDKWSKCASHAFTHANLNTGHTFTWVHVIC